MKARWYKWKVKQNKTIIGVLKCVCVSYASEDSTATITHNTQTVSFVSVAILSFKCQLRLFTILVQFVYCILVFVLDFRYCKYSYTMFCCFLCSSLYVVNKFILFQVHWFFYLFICFSWHSIQIFSLFDKSTIKICAVCK